MNGWIQGFEIEGGDPPVTLREKQFIAALLRAHYMNQLLFARLLPEAAMLTDAQREAHVEEMIRTLARDHFPDLRISIARDPLR